MGVKETGGCSAVSFCGHVSGRGCDGLWNVTQHRALGLRKERVDRLGRWVLLQAFYTAVLLGFAHFWPSLIKCTVSCRIVLSAKVLEWWCYWNGFKPEKVSFAFERGDWLGATVPPALSDFSFRASPQGEITKSVFVSFVALCLTFSDRKCPL